MNTFGRTYARYYDLFYRDKDYTAEAKFVGDIVRMYKPEARNILDLGCGSGGHAIRLVDDGYAVTGIDLSAEMIACAVDRVKCLPPSLRERATFQHGDATLFEPSKTFDAVVSLFHVVSYQTTNKALHGFFRSARAALNPGGVFVFDFWYGPAVLFVRPQVRVRRSETPEVQVTRIAEPALNSATNVVDVKYTLITIDKRTHKSVQSMEVHSMRYLFLPEIELLASLFGFEIIKTIEWLSDKPLNENTWSGCAIARAVSLSN